MTFPGNPRRADWATWAAPAALCLALAVAMFVRLQAIAIQGGEFDYLEWAMKHYFGGITPIYLKLSSQILSLQYTSLAYPPGYPALLAAFQVAGIDGLQSMRVAQAAIDCAGVLLAYFLLRRAGIGTALALCGAAVYAMYPNWAFGSTFLLAEFISPVLMLAALALVVSCGERERPSPALTVLAGIALGLFAMIRPDFLLLPGLLALWLAWRHRNRRGLAAAAALIAGFAIPVSGWGLHNRVEHGHWVFSTTGGGNALWEGLGALPNDYGFVLDDKKAGEYLATKGLTWLSVEADRHFRSEYFRAVREHPEFVLKVIAYRWRHVASDSEGWLPEAGSTWGLKRLFDYGGVVFVAIAALLHRRSPVRLLLILTPVLYALGSIGMTHWEPRYGRYVHLSYLFSLILIIDWLAARAGRRLRWAGLAILALPCAWTAWAVTDVVRQARSTAVGTVALAAAEASAARGPLPGGHGLCSLAFVKFVPDAKLARRDCELEVVTSPEPFFYQAMASVSIPPGSVVMARFSGHVTSGGISIGLMTSNERDFIAQWGTGKSGDFEGRLTAYTGNRDALKVVVSNFNQPGGSSTATLRAFDLKCHPVPCGPGTGGK